MRQLPRSGESCRAPCTRAAWPRWSSWLRPAVLLLVVCGPGCRRAEPPQPAAMPTRTSAAAEATGGDVEPAWTPEPTRVEAPPVVAAPTEGPTVRPTIDLVYVTARNSCSRWIPVDESWFEVKAFPYGSAGTSGRETGQFQAAIGPNGSAETLIEIDCPGGQCRYVVTVR